MRPPAEEPEVHHRHSGHGGGHGGATRRDHVVISTVIVGVILFLFIGTPYLKHHMPPGGGLLNAIGGSDADLDRDREAVRLWLRENADDPHPHEVRWWPARELGRLHQDRLDAARAAAEDDSRLIDQVQQLEDDGPDRVCRLEYRTKSETGDEITRDDLFVVRHGKARLLARDSSLAVAARKSFTDSQGLP